MNTQQNIYSLLEMILIIYIASWFCAGWRLVTDKGMILYFLRRRIDEKRSVIENEHAKASSEVRNVVQLGFCGGKNSINELIEKEHERLQEVREKKMKKLSIYKPLITCVTCFASFWGTSVFVSLAGVHTGHDVVRVIVSVVCISYLSTKRYNELNFNP